MQPLPPLRVVGERGWLYETVYRRYEALGLGDRVQFVGGVDAAALPELYRGARAFVMPSLYEGFGLGALEALACGTPVLAADAGALPEVVGTPGCSCRRPIPPPGPRRWSGCCSTRRWPPICGRAGRPRRRSFSWARAARETLGVYRGVN